MTSRPRLVGAGALILAVGILIGGVTGGTFAAFSRTTATGPDSFTADTLAAPGTPVSVHTGAPSGMTTVALAPRRAAAKATP